MYHNVIEEIHNHLLQIDAIWHLRLSDSHNQNMGKMSGGAKVGKPTIQTILAAVLTDEAGIA